MSQAEQNGSSEDTKASLVTLVRRLEEHLPGLKQQRQSTAIANDIFEAVDDWIHAGRLVLNNDTRVDFKARAFSERKLLEAISASLNTKSVEQQQQYAPLLEMGSQLIEALQSVPSTKNGHLGVLRIIREQFSFLQQDYDFVITHKKPTGLRFSSGAVFLELEYATTSDLSCRFGQVAHPEHHFWIQDLLYLYKDQRYKSIPWKLDLRSDNEVEAWFKQLADFFKQYGKRVLVNDRGIFDLLDEAQTARDEEIARMNTGE